MDMGDLISVATATAKAHGFGAKGPRPVPEHTSLIHSEVSELFEEWRDGMDPTVVLYEHPGRTGADKLTATPEHGLDEEAPKPVGIPIELADVVIRCANMAGELGIDLEAAISEKLLFNGARPYLHGREH